LTDVTRLCPNVKRIVPSSSMRIGVTSEYYRRTSSGSKKSAESSAGPWIRNSHF
jgi:hypothetical protein